MTLGVPLPDIYEALQATIGAAYVNDFNRSGRTYRVLMQAEPRGMVILPLLGALTGMMMAFASTPVSLHRVDRRWTMRQANFLISLAGPAVNVVIADVVKRCAIDEVCARQCFKREP